MTLSQAGAWYCVAWGTDVPDGSMIRCWLHERPIVLCRDTFGRIVAFDDRCCHRSFPLTDGRLVDGEIQCGYHGFRFGMDGRCTGAPSCGTPPRAQLKRYAVVERYRWIWVWSGDAVASDPTRIPELPWMDDPSWAVVGGSAVISARIQLVVENFCDLTHETYLHPTTLGNKAVVENPLEVDVVGPTVRARRLMSSCDPPPFYDAFAEWSGPIDRSQDLVFEAPSLWRLHVRLANAGDQGPGLNQHITYAITPETESRTRETWSVARDFAVGDAQVDQLILDNVHAVILEDTAALERQEEMYSLGEVPEISVRADRAAIAARRLIEDARG